MTAKKKSKSLDQRRTNDLDEDFRRAIEFDDYLDDRRADRDRRAKCHKNLVPKNKGNYILNSLGAEALERDCRCSSSI